MIESVTADAEAETLKFVAMLNVPADCSIKLAGLVADENKDNLIAGTAKFTKTKTTSCHNYQYTWTKTKVTSDQTWYVKAYLVYIDADGNEHTVYGDTVAGKLN